MTPVLLVLCSAIFHSTLTSSHLRQFLPVKRRAGRDKALLECEKNTSTLVTVYDKDDANFIHNYMQSTVWLGLHRSQDNPTKWSNGVPFTFNASVATLRNGDQLCEAVDNSTWRAFNCSDTKPFMCYNDANAYFLIEKEMNWCQARGYCRRHHTNLVSISNETQNQEVIKMGKNRTFWIGLLHDEWKWEGEACSTFREWSTPLPGAPEKQNCTRQMNVGGTEWKKISKVDCASTARVLCSKENQTMKIKVIEKYLTWEKAFDYCKANHTRLLWIDSADDQRAVEQWLYYNNVSGPLWLGLRQSRIFGFWIWSSDKVVGYSYWKDDTEPELPLSHHCGAIDANDKYRWSDKDCRLQLRFLCEEHI